jgi:uncharacterized protein YdeI (YjbR/CyaY-like superfamily)
LKRLKTPEEYIASNKDWQQSLILLRDILLSTQMTETIKWGVPVYTFEGKKIVPMILRKIGLNDKYK